MSRMLSLDKIDRPREKLLANGGAFLSDEELLQVIIGSGVKGADVTRIAKEVLGLLESENGKVTLDQLINVKGVSSATAAKLIASLEIATRFIKTGFKIRTPEDAMMLLADIRSKKQEHLVVLTLDGGRRLIDKHLVSVGTLSANLVHPREVFVRAISDHAASIIIAHNHPAGTLEPSQADIEVTKRLKDAGEIIGIKMLDHLIVTENDYVRVSQSENI